MSGTVALGNTVTAAATVSYADGPSSGTDRWEGELGAYWAATPQSQVGLELRYNTCGSAGPDDTWGVHARFETMFGS